MRQQLALVALGMMFMMVRKASRPQPLPTAEELVGIPPALQADVSRKSITPSPFTSPIPVASKPKVSPGTLPVHSLISEASFPENR